MGTSFSAGLAIADGLVAARELVARADRAMYDEKHERRAVSSSLVTAASLRAASRRRAAAAAGSASAPPAAGGVVQPEPVRAGRSPPQDPPYSRRSRPSRRGRKCRRDACSSPPTTRAFNGASRRASSSSSGEAGFALGLSFGYGIDFDSVILVPGVHLTALFTDPNVYYGMPVVKLLIPIDRFAPFIEGGGGVGFVDGSNGADGKTGAAIMGGGGFEVYFRHFAIGAEANYTTITGTSFHGIGIGPILAIGF